MKFEWQRVHMCNIMICTPGRLLQHLTENVEFSTDNVQVRHYYYSSISLFRYSTLEIIYVALYFL